MELNRKGCFFLIMFSVVPRYFTVKDAHISRGGGLVCLFFLLISASLPPAA